MPINIQTGPTAGLSGAVGFAAGKRQYEDEQKSIERQLRQQELQNNLRSIQGVGQALQPFVNNAIQKQTRQWQDEADMKKTQAIMAAKRDPKNIAAAGQAAVATEVQAIKGAQAIKHQGLEYLKSIGPAAAGFATRQNGERVVMGGGNGMLDEKQFLAALNQIDERAQRFGKGVGSGMTNQEVLAQRLVTDPGTGNQFLVTGSKSNPTITPVNNTSGDRKLKMKEAAATHVRTMGVSFEKQYQNDLSRLTGQWMDSGDTPEQIIAKAKVFRKVMESQRPGSENNPWDKWITDALATEAGPAAGVGGLGAASAGPLERAQRGLQGGGPPLNLGGMGGGQPQPQPQRQIPQPQPQPVGGGGGLPEMTVTRDGRPIQLGRTNQQVTEEAQRLGDGARAWRQDLPRSASFWDDPEQDRMLGRLSEQRFHAELDVFGGMDEGRLQPRRYGLVGPKVKEKVGGWSGEPFHYERDDLKHALSAIRYANDAEMRLPENLTLITSGGESANLHRVRDAALSYLHDVQNQLDMSERTPPEKGYGGGKPKKWLYGGSPIQMPDILREWKIAPEANRLFR